MLCLFFEELPPSPVFELFSKYAYNVEFENGRPTISIYFSNVPEILEGLKKFDPNLVFRHEIKKDVPIFLWGKDDNSNQSKMRDFEYERSSCSYFPEMPMVEQKPILSQQSPPQIPTEELEKKLNSTIKTTVEEVLAKFSTSLQRDMQKQFKSLSANSTPVRVPHTLPPPPLPTQTPQRAAPSNQPNSAPANRNPQQYRFAPPQIPSQQAARPSAPTVLPKEEIIANGINCAKCSRTLKAGDITTLVDTLRTHSLEHFEQKCKHFKRFKCLECPHIQTNFVKEMEDHLKKHGCLERVPDKRARLVQQIMSQDYLDYLAETANECFPDVFESNPQPHSSIGPHLTPQPSFRNVFPHLHRDFCSRYGIRDTRMVTRRNSNPAQMEFMANSFRRAEWRIRKMLNLKRQTIVPVVWNEQLFRNSHFPSKEFQRTLDSEAKTKLSRIIKEFQIISRLSIRFPKQIDDKEWKIILECQTRKQRFDQVLFLYQVENLREKERAKKSEMREININKTKMNYPYSLVYRSVWNQKIYEELKSLNTYRLNNKPTIAIDCQFLAKLSPRGQQLTASQLQYLIKENRELPEPLKLYFVNYYDYPEDLEKKKLSGINSLEKVNPIISSDSFSKIFPLEKIVYLSPDGEETLENVEDDKVYIIGGIVDRVFEKGIGKTASKDAAIRENVKYAKLPIDKYIDFKSGSKFLTILAVVNILNDVNCHGDWEKALRKWIPVRNVKSVEEKNRNILLIGKSGEIEVSDLTCLQNRINLDFF
ncbi:unnamed protein product [Caenorhabditis angaria]|uniref:RNA (guanine-9-)-methyltransferase domain-containing protein 1 n=1 Tax=Caenorhabditis angaria TaxID=860376 RepID=A0A9P1MST3_9PELO|nr:unnamed protein product [Caenorhabditis angaria]